MLFDWFTVGAQALNFLILVFLLWRFLYKPILQAIDEREKRIAAELADADAKSAAAQQERDEYQHKSEVLDQERASLLKKATDEAKQGRQRLLDEARQAADALRSKRQASLQDDAHSLNQALGERARREVFAIARKALTELAGASLEERVAEVFTRRLSAMQGPAKATLAEALKTATAPALVRSAFDLPPQQRAAIQAAINETFSADLHLRFEKAPDLVSGIELTTDGLKVGWSIAEYLTSLEEGVGELLKQQDETKTKREGKREGKRESKREVGSKPTPTKEAAPGAGHP